MAETVNIRFPRRLRQAAKLRAVERNMSLQEFLEECVFSEINRSRPVVIDKVAERASKLVEHRGVIELLLDFLELNPPASFRSSLVDYLKGVIAIARLKRDGA